MTPSIPSTPRASESARLLVTCPDRRGIVAALAQLLYGQGANILDSDQHTDPEAGIFFQRIRFDLADLRVDRQGLERAIAEVAERMDMTWRLEYSDHVKRMAIFVSKQDHCLYDLLLRHRAGEFECEIPLIVSNHPDAKSIAEQFDVAFEVFPIAKDTRREQEHPRDSCSRVGAGGAPNLARASAQITVARRRPVFLVPSSLKLDLLISCVNRPISLRETVTAASAVALPSKATDSASTSSSSVGVRTWAFLVGVSVVVISVLPLSSLL